MSICSRWLRGAYALRPQYAVAPLGSHSILMGTRLPASMGTVNLYELGFQAVRQRSGTTFLPSIHTDM